MKNLSGPVCVPARERPILFNGPMVRAILDGRKTQTRRMIKPQPDITPDQVEILPEAWAAGFIPVECPFGDIGDRLWVRETWSPDSRKAYPYYSAVYRASDGEYSQHKKDCIDNAKYKSEESHAPEGCLCEFRWRPSIFMPRERCRITLEITDVRVQRLKDLSNNDAKSEGVESVVTEAFPPRDEPLPIHKLAFSHLWDSIADKETNWDSNPWVWVISFGRLP